MTEQELEEVIKELEEELEGLPKYSWVYIEKKMRLESYKFQLDKIRNDEE